MRLRSRRALAAALLVAAYAAVALPSAVGTAVSWIRGGARNVGDGPAAARRRVLGEPYATGIEAIERAVPPGADYFAVDADAKDRHELSWVRFDLAPRRGIYWGKLRGFRRFPVPLALEVKPPPYVVISYGAERAPEAVPSAAFLEGTVVPRGREDGTIPAALDAPAENARLSGEVVVNGWCQEEGSRPCPRVRVLLDGREAKGARVERSARPDVAQVFPRMGDVSRAGYRASLALPPDQAGEHDVTVLVETDDGRFRRLGPRVFGWAP